MHQTQINIIMNLAFVTSSRYSELKPLGMEGSQFTYHLDELQKIDLIVKRGVNGYSLTAKGKQFANTLDITTAEIIKRQIITTLITAKKEIDGETAYLLYTKKRSPWIRCQGFITSRVLYGENIIDAANRGLLERTGLTGTPTLFHTFHSVVSPQEKNIVEDFVLFAYVYENTVGELKTSEIGDAKWVKKSELKSYVKKPIFKFHEIMKVLQTFKKPAGLTEFSGLSSTY